MPDDGIGDGGYGGVGDGFGGSAVGVGIDALGMGGQPGPDTSAVSQGVIGGLVAGGAIANAAGNPVGAALAMGVGGVSLGMSMAGLIGSSINQDPAMAGFQFGGGGLYESSSEAVGAGSGGDGGSGGGSAAYYDYWAYMGISQNSGGYG